MLDILFPVFMFFMGWIGGSYLAYKMGFHSGVHMTLVKAKKLDEFIERQHNPLFLETWNSFLSQVQKLEDNLWDFLVRKHGGGE